MLTIQLGTEKVSTTVQASDQLLCYLVSEGCKQK